MSNELKQCPFCGGEAEYRAAKYARTPFKHSVVCLECFASVPPKDSKHEAINAWNTRAERTCHLERIPYEPGEYEGMRCSVCKTVDLEMGVGPYCPGCGAKVVE